MFRAVKRLVTRAGGVIESPIERAAARIDCRHARSLYACRRHALRPFSLVLPLLPMMRRVALRLSANYFAQRPSAAPRADEKEGRQSSTALAAIDYRHSLRRCATSRAAAARARLRAAGVQSPKSRRPTADANTRFATTTPAPTAYRHKPADVHAADAIFIERCAPPRLLREPIPGARYYSTMLDVYRLQELLPNLAATPRTAAQTSSSSANFGDFRDISAPFRDELAASRRRARCVAE